MLVPVLPPDAAQGCALLLDPESRDLRAALTAPAPAEDALLRTADLLDDLQLFHRLLRKQYAGYPDLLQHPDFDPDTFFTAWEGRLRGAGPMLTFRDALVPPLVALRQVLPDHHLTFRAAEPALAKEPSLTFHEFQRRCRPVRPRPSPPIPLTAS